MLVRCAKCGTETDKPTGHVNRSRNIGAPVYCGRECSALAKRKFKPTMLRKIEKAAYDRQYRERNADRLRQQKAAYFARTYDPESAAVARKRGMARHVERCRDPEYREYKREYDKRYRASKDFGPFAEVAMLLQDIETEIAARASKYEIYLSSGRINKKLKRRRDYESTFGGEP